MSHTAESHHWYDRSGSPVFEVPDATGKRMIEPDLRHARKLGLVPGFSAVERILAAPNLERWKRHQAILAALTLTRGEGESDEDFLARVELDSRAHAMQRADEGKEIHKAIEQFLKGETYDTRWHAHVSAVVKLLHSLGESFVADFKTKERLAGKQERELFFDNHAMQLVAYKRGLAGKFLEGAKDGPVFRCETTFANPKGYGGRVDVHTPQVDMGSRCVSILVSVEEPGELRAKTWTAEEQERAMSMFDHALALWQQKHRYDSSWT